MRGGMWGNDASHARVAARFYFNPGFEDDGITGFRCVRGP
jgi:formylglycine-generating enzyme required for sulfatase activity